MGSTDEFESLHNQHLHAQQQAALIRKASSFHESGLGRHGPPMIDLRELGTNVLFSLKCMCNVLQDPTILTDESKISWSKRPKQNIGALRSTSFGAKTERLNPTQEKIEAVKIMTHLALQADGKNVKQKIASILVEQEAVKKQLKTFNIKFNLMKVSIDEKLTSMEKKLDSKLGALTKNIDGLIEAMRK